MKVLVKISLLMVVMMSLTECYQTKEETTFSETIKELNGSILVKEDLLNDPWTIEIMDSLLFIGNLKNQPFVEVYNRFSGELLSSFLSYGQGPLDVLGFDFQNVGNNKLFILDFITKKMLLLNKNYISRENVLIEPFFTLSDYDEDIVNNITKGAYLNDQYNIVTTTNNKGRIGLLNKEDHTLNYFYPFTDDEVLSPELDSHINNSMFSSDMTVCVENNRIAFSTHNADMLYIYEYSDDKLDPVWSHKSFLPNEIKVLTFENTIPQAFLTNKSVSGYNAITSSSRNVYALFIGFSMEDGDIAYSNKIRVFDWNGEHRFEIRTNYSLKRIAVDKDDHFLYGISKEDEAVIVCFDLKDLLEK
jgi:hypothetical protein